MSDPAYLLPHGAWAGHSVWDRVAPQLRACDHLVVAPDLPGGGPEAIGKTVTVEDMGWNRTSDAAIFSEPTA